MADLWDVYGLFVGSDGRLYRVFYSVSGPTPYGSDWDVAEVRLEWWSQVWPLDLDSFCAGAPI